MDNTPAHQGKSIIVFGPQGCGKTRNARAIADHYGLRSIFDDASFNTIQDWKNAKKLAKSKSGPALFLTNAPLFAGETRHFQAIPYTDAAAAAGVK